MKNFFFFLFFFNFSISYGINYAGVTNGFETQVEEVDTNQELEGDNSEKASSFLKEKFFGMKIVDSDIQKLIVRFGINFLFAFIIIYLIYYTSNRKKNYVFAYIMISVIVFFLCFALKKLSLDFGLALGLFAVFGVLRYRTNSIPVKEMTYLFVIIGLAVTNSLAGKKFSWGELLFINLAITTIILVLEKIFLYEKTNAKAEKVSNSYRNRDITIGRMDLIQPSNELQLISYLKEKTGLLIERVKIEEIDLKNEVAVIKVYYPKEVILPE